MSTLFISHGAPTLALEPGVTGELLAGLGQTLPRPRAILVVSAHWDTRTPRVSTAAQPETIHDFGGFPAAMYQIQYPAAGAPALAQQVQALLGESDTKVELDPARGLDHGAWVPLMLMYPEADIPVTQLSIQSHAGAAAHFALGQQLAALQADGVMLLCSGAITHNLQDFFTSDREAAVLDYVPAFSDWMAQHIAAGDTEALLDYRRLAPAATRAHPHEDHLLPLFVALGAAEKTAAEKTAVEKTAAVRNAGENTATNKPVRHQPENTYGILAMDTYVWQ